MNLIMNHCEMIFERNFRISSTFFSEGIVLDFQYFYCPWFPAK